MYTRVNMSRSACASPVRPPRAHVRKKQSVAHTGQKQTDRHSNARGHALRVRVRYRGVRRRRRSPSR